MSFLWNTTILKFQLSISLMKVLPMGFWEVYTDFFAKYLLYTGCVWQLRGIAFCIARRCRQQKESLSPVPRAFAGTDCSTTTDHVPRKYRKFMCRFFWATYFLNKKLKFRRFLSFIGALIRDQNAILPSIGCNCSCTISSNTFSAALRQKPFSQALMTALQVITSNWSEVQFITWCGCKIYATKIHELSKFIAEWIAFGLGFKALETLCIFDLYWFLWATEQCFVTWVIYLLQWLCSHRLK